MNTLKISGTVYKPSQRFTSTGKLMTTFGLMFANKKQPDGKFKGQFVNVKCFKEIGTLNERDKVEIDGFLVQDEYTNKKGEQVSNLAVIANSISFKEEKPQVDESRLPQDDFSW